MTRARIHLSLYLSLICCALMPLWAQSAGSAESVVPGMVKFAGTLNDLNGKPFIGTVGVTFLLYKEESGGTPLWTETQNVLPDKSGHYSVMLGSVSSHGIPADAFAAGEARWIGVQPSGQPEQPRVELGSVPYALKAADAQTLGGLPPSAFVLAPTAGSTTAVTAAEPATSSSQPSGSIPVTTAGGTAKALAKFDANADIASSQVFDNGTNVGVGTSSPKVKLDVKGAATVRGAFSLPATGTATATVGKNSQPQSLTASAFNSAKGTAVPQTFQWQAEATGNNTSNADASLNLLFGRGPGAPAETGLNIGSNGQIKFAAGQTFPGTGNGSVTSVGLSAPTTDFSVSGSPVTGSGTLNLQWLLLPTSASVANAIVKRDALGNFSANGITVTVGSVEVTAAGEGLGAVSTDNRPFTPAVSGRATATGDGSTHGINGFSSTNQGAGVFGHSDGTAGAGVLGQNDVSGFGVFGQAQGASGQGVVGESLGTQISANGFGPDGVDGISHSTNGAGVGAVNTTGGDGLFAQSNGGLAGFFLGNVRVDGNLDVNGTVSKAAGSFKIDHPLDPANKYLYHSFVESPDMKNIYDGTITTDASGNATVILPDWFDALNRDFRYQLTVIGQFAQAIVASEMANHSFTIRTDKPNVKVSWQVTGIRQDAYANAHRIPVEQVKPERERGFYLHPELFGAAADKSMAEAHHPGLLKRMTVATTKSADPSKE